MNKKILKILLSIFLILIVNINATKVNAETTEYLNHWASDVITSFAEKDFINANLKDFNPNDEITKGEASYVINRFFSYGEAESLAENLEIAKEHGYFFNASIEAKITREEIAVIICNLISIEPTKEKELEFVDDLDISEWSKDYIYTLQKAEIVVGYPDKTYKPQKNISKAEFITILNRCTGIGGNNLVLIDKEVENIEVGIISYEDENVIVTTVLDELHLKLNEQIELALSLPANIEEDEINIEITSGKENIEFDEDFYILKALKSGKASIILYTKDYTFKTEIKIVIK